MIQLKTTGYIHNRPRLVAAIYLTKHLKIHWRWAEKHFAIHLVDYDFAQNFGNWCWVASVLPFSMAPFRSLNPEIQLNKFDPERNYIKRYLKD
jgi:deoxyribodipyrimidine photo-lyase